MEDKITNSIQIQDKNEEIENSGIAKDRIKEYYKLKAYVMDCVDKKLSGIAIKQDLIDE